MRNLERREQRTVALALGMALVVSLSWILWLAHLCIARGMAKAADFAASKFAVIPGNAIRSSRSAIPASRVTINPPAGPPRLL